MPPVKTFAENQASAGRAPAPDQQPALPEKQAGSTRPGAIQRAAAALPPPDDAAAMLMGTEVGGAGRARAMRAMQSSVGNARVSRMLRAGVQAKLTVNAPGDVYEQEADRVAENVTQKSPAIQRAAASPEVPDVTPEIESRIQSARGNGQTLVDGVRAPMEQDIGADFGRVRVHTDATADQLNRTLDARAFTTGPDIFFKSGEYNPDIPGGHELLAHELTHTVQQGASMGRRVQRDAAAGMTSATAPASVPAPASTAASSSQATGSTAMLSGTDRARIREILQQKWVGPRDEYELEAIWGKYKDEGLVQVALNDFALWEESYERGAELDDFEAVKAIRSHFERDVKDVATSYMQKNRDYILAEATRLGLPLAGPSGPVTKSQEAEMAEIRDAAKRVTRAQKHLEDLQLIQVGTKPPSDPRMGNIKLPVLFDPQKPPVFPFTEADQPKWEEVKKQYDRTNNVIAGLSKRYSAIQAAIMSDAVGKVAAETPEQARSVVNDSFKTVLKNIEETVPKLADDDLDYRDLTPIHAQLHTRAVPAPSGTDWGNPFNRWAAQTILEDHETKKFWESIGLGTLAAAAFVIAALATGGASIFFTAVGIGAGLLQAGKSWENYLDLATASKTSLDNETALVSQGQVTAALIDSVLNTVFAFIDMYGAFKVAGTAGKAALRAGGRAAFEKEEKLLAEGVAKEATKKSEQEAAQAALQKGGAASVRGLLHGAQEFLEALFTRLKELAGKIFEGFGFKGFEVAIEGEWVVLYGIRSRLRLAQFPYKEVEHHLNLRAGRRVERKQLLEDATKFANTLWRSAAKDISEEIGEEAAIRAAKGTLKGVGEPVFIGRGRNSVDLVFKGPQGKYIIVEAKGGAGKLIEREIGGGKRAGQGTIAYLRSVLGDMANASGETKKIADEVLLALQKPGNNVEYHVAVTKIPDDATTGLVTKIYQTYP